MKMNRFRVNLHPAFFDSLEKVKEPADTTDNQETLTRKQKKEAKKQEKERKLKEAKEQAKAKEQSTIERAKVAEDVLKDSILRNNESLATKEFIVETKEEKEQSDEEITKELEKQLKQLAKNKKIDFPWTDNAWKCSRTEKKLATASARVFQQLLDAGKLQEMAGICKSRGGDLSKDGAEMRGRQLGINSKSKDILKFYKAYQEYQNPQSGYQHLKNLMGFFFESGFENTESLRTTMKERSEKITRKERNGKAKELYHGEIKKNKWGEEYYVMVDEDGNPRPKDWKERSSFEAIKSRLESNTNGTEQMLTLLGDFNLDGEVNSGDVGYKTGSQVAEVFRRVVATKHLEDAKFDDNEAIKNLVAYANKCGMNIEGVQSVDGLYKWMTAKKIGYDNTKKLQNFLRNLPIELGDVFSNGVAAGKESLKTISSALNIEAAERESAEKAATEKAQEFVDKYDSLLKDRIKDATKRANITQQLLSQLPGVLMNEARNMQKGLGVGVAIPLNELIRGLSLGLNVGIDKDGTPRAGIYGAWDHNFKLGKGFDASTGVSAGLNCFFIPCESLFVELGYDVSENRRKKTLDATGINRVSLGANCTMYGPIFSWGVSAGFEHNKKGGIEKQAKNINGQIKSQALNLVDAIKNKPEGQTDEDALKLKLKELFPKSSEEELKNATNNILQIISQFNIDEKTTDRDKDIYAQIVADAYTEMWRNEAISGITDNKRKLSGGKVGVQFLAGFCPTVTLVAKFTKYYNARTKETEYSRMAKLDAQVNGTNNKKIDLGDSKEIGQEKVNQINEVLKRYGAKKELEYIAGADGKPGKIQVPASIADGAGVNVRVSENLKGYVRGVVEKQLGGETFYQFPANATYRLLQETGGNQRSITLNIGSDKSTISDIMLSDKKKMKELEGDKELMGSKKLEYKDPTTESIEYKPDFSSLFTNEVVEGLKTIDSSDWAKFSEFMKNKTDANAKFEEMKEALVNVLGNDTKYNDIKEMLDSKDVSQGDKQLVMDRIMAISVEANVHNKNGLDANVSHRKEAYKTLEMRGPNGKAIFSELTEKDYRVEVLKQIHNENNYEVVDSNILGATAFYNRNNLSKGLALTGLGATKVLGGKTIEIGGTDRENVKNWFFGYENGEENNVPGVLEEQKSPAEWFNLKRIIQGKLPEGASLSDGNLKRLLKGEEIEFNLDNSQKKVKVKLDVKYVFYLMGECANESVGIELGNLQVQEQQEVDDYAQGSLYLNDFDGYNQVDASRRDFAVGISLGGGKKAKSPEVPDNTAVKTDDATQGGKGFTTNPSDTTDIPVDPKIGGTGTEEIGGGGDDV